MQLMHLFIFSPPLQEQLTDRQVKNFTKDWNDGTSIAALVDAMAPGLCPEYAIMNPENALENASHAMKMADDWLDVPQVRESGRGIVLVDGSHVGVVGCNVGVVGCNMI